MINKVSHIGIAVKDLDQAIALYKSLGLALEGVEEVPSQKVKVAFFPVGDTRIELLQPTGEDSPVAAFIEKKGEGIHHLAFAVDDVVNSLQETASAGFKLIDQAPRPGAHHAQIAFLHPKSTGGVLMELCQEHQE